MALHHEVTQAIDAAVKSAVAKAKAEILTEVQALLDRDKTQAETEASDDAPAEKRRKRG